jgi:hypothetical protein
MLLRMAHPAATGFNGMMRQLKAPPEARQEMAALADTRQTHTPEAQQPGIMHLVNNRRHSLQLNNHNS